MPYKPSLIQISCPKPSYDGKYYGRYPNGDAPVSTRLSGTALDLTSGTGALASPLVGNASTRTSATGALSLSTAGQTINFQPGCYMLSTNVNGSPSNTATANGAQCGGGNSTEITKIIASIKKAPTIFKGYAPQYYWCFLDGPTLGAYNFDPIFADANALWAKADAAGVVAYFVPLVSAYAIYTDVFNATGGLDILPAYIFNGGSTYGDAPSGGNGNGWALTNYYSGSKYYFVTAALWNTNVNTRYELFWQALYNAEFTPTSGPWAGVTTKFGECAGVSGMVDWTDADPSMTGSPTTPADYSSSAWGANRVHSAETIPGYMPKIPFALMGGYGASGQAISDQLTLVDACYNNRCGLSASDIFWTGTATDLTYAQNYLVGNTYSGSSLVVGGGTSRVGQMLVMPCGQPADYHALNGHVSTEEYTAAQATALMNMAYNTLGAQYVFMAQDDDRYYGNWSGTDKQGNTAYIETGIIAAGPPPAANQTYPY